jgi:hypothetical protein
MPVKVGMVTFQGDGPYELPLTLSAATRPANGHIELLLTLDTSQEDTIQDLPPCVLVRTRLSRTVALVLADNLVTTVSTGQKSD